MNTDNTPGNRELADLLPFYLTGRLPMAQMQRIEAALATDEALKRELALVEEEQAATIEANELLCLPSQRASDRLFAMLDAEPERASPKAARKDMFAWLGERLRALSSRQMAFAGVAAAVLVVAQAGVIGGLMREPPETKLGTASAGGQTVEFAAATVMFAPTAKLADISQLLDSVHGTIVDGPGSNGLYTVRIGAKHMSEADRDAVVARLAAQKAVVIYAGRRSQ